MDSIQRKWTVFLVLAWAFLFACNTLEEKSRLKENRRPMLIQKYADPLPIPGIMSKADIILEEGQEIDYYEIAVRQFDQQVLSSVDIFGNPFPKTTVWSYGTVDPLGDFHYPSFSIEAQVNRPVRIKWVNQLVDNDGNFLPHLLPIDQTLHWANPSQSCADGTTKTDCNGNDPTPYSGPVPIVVHLHGGHTEPHSDGYPEAWYLPEAANIPTGFATRGSNFGQIPGAPLEEGAAVFQYRNDQRAGTLWFHDHTLGMTRTNVYAGPAGFYLLRGGPDDVPSGVTGGLPAGDYEIPLAIQDRSFNSDGSLFYPDSRSFFDGFPGPYIGDGESDIPPSWNPEFFGDTIVVNGKTWPYLNVEPRKYRFRILNGSDSRFFILSFRNPKINFTQIGSEGGFLPRPVVLDQLLIAPAERADVIIDFSQLKPGQKVILHNFGPDEPFGGLPISDSEKSDPSTTGQVMQFRVIPLTGPDRSAIPSLPTITPIDTSEASIRKVSLNELESDLVCVDRNNSYLPGLTPPDCGDKGSPLAPLIATLGTVNEDGEGEPLLWGDTITENPLLGAAEIWEIQNFTADAHPIHIHMIMFQIIDRTDMLTGDVFSPESWETGFKDTVIANPGQITRIKALYDIEGLFVWHCHILSHEDNEMMRPYCVGDGCSP